MGLIGNIVLGVLIALIGGFLGFAAVVGCLGMYLAYKKSKEDALVRVCPKVNPKVKELYPDD